MASVPKSLISPQEYLERERRAEYKSEYIAGEVLAMAGASREHNLISTNILVEFVTQLRGHSCEAYGSDMRVRIGLAEKYVYPDVTVVCGKPQFEDKHLDVLLNPLLIVEVLSPTTERYDRGTKCAAYRNLESVQECLLVSQNTVRVDHYVRQPSGEWVIRQFNRLEDSIRLVSVPAVLKLSEVYRQVDIGSL
jgi:Uma2 family endonuclease